MRLLKVAASIRQCRRDFCWVEVSLFWTHIHYSPVDFCWEKQISPEFYTWHINRRGHSKLFTFHWSEGEQNAERSKTKQKPVVVSLHFSSIWSFYKTRNPGLLFGSYQWHSTAPNPIGNSISWVSISLNAIQFLTQCCGLKMFFS